LDNKKRLFVGNLPFTVTEDSLTELFGKAGKVASVKIITDKYSGRSKGFAFVEMEDEKAAEEAIKLYNDTELEGRKIVVNVARPMEERPRRDFGGGDRGGGDRGGGGFRRDTRGGSRGGGRY